MSSSPPSEIPNRVKDLAGLDNSEVNELTGIGITTEDDLSWLEFEDLPVTISIVKRRKIEIISKFMAIDDGAMLLRNTSLRKIRKAVKNHDKQASAPENPAPSQSSKIDRNGPKITTNPLLDFSGKAWHWEDWVRVVKSTLGQASQFTEYLWRAPSANISEEKARNKELYHMLAAAVGNRQA